MDMTNTARTYLALLLLPHNGLRAKLQGELAACRDAIALCAESDAETVQNDFEAKAAMLANRLPGLFCVPATVVNDDMKITTAVFEDTAYVARPLFAGIPHWIDELRAMDDNRLVGIQIWATTPPVTKGDRE